MPNEIQIQGQAFSECCANTIELIARHAELFRDIVEGFKADQDRLPTADEILYVASERLEHDIRKES